MTYLNYTAGFVVQEDQKLKGLLQHSLVKNSFTDSELLRIRNAEDKIRESKIHLKNLAKDNLCIC